VSTSVKRILFVLLCSVVLSSTASAQQSTAFSQGNRPMLGPQAGIATNHLDLFVGAQFSYPIANQFDIYPSFDIFFPGNGVTVWGINAEGRYWPKLNMPNSGLYVGGGINITHTSVSGFSSTDAGLGLLGGWDFKAVSWRPFAQLHIVVGNADRIEFGGGVNFKL
jgi:opacity protein-like surface antigen